MNQPAPPVIEMNSDQRVLAILCHVSIFLGISIILPLIVYLVKRKEDALVTEHAAETLNFHLSILIYSLVCIPLFFIFVGFFLFFGIAIASLVLAIIGTIKAAENDLYRYPLTIRFVGS